MNSLQKCKQGFPDHLEFAFEVGGEYILAEAVVYILQIPPASFIDFIVIRMQFICTHYRKDIYKLPFYR